MLLDLKERFETLTSREREVMVFVTDGLVNKQIAYRMGVSEITVKIHRGNVMREMRARSLADLARMGELLDIRTSTERGILEKSRGLFPEKSLRCSPLCEAQ